MVTLNNTLHEMIFRLSDDGSVTAADARLALRASVRLESYAPSSDAFYVADTDMDGKITAADARFILRVSVRLENKIMRIKNT